VVLPAAAPGNTGTRASLVPVCLAETSVDTLPNERNTTTRIGIFIKLTSLHAGDACWKQVKREELPAATFFRLSADDIGGLYSTGVSTIPNVQVQQRKK
jgi:hypothetical protein